MLSKFSKWILFFSSYIPLLLIICIQNYPQIELICICIAICFILIGFLNKLLTSINAYNSFSATIIRVNNQNAEAINYLFVYIIPFISLDITEPKNLIAFSLLFLIIGSVYTSNDMIHINPILTLFFKYNIYSAVIKSNMDIENNIIILSKKSQLDLFKLSEVKLCKLNGKIFIESSK